MAQGFVQVPVDSTGKKVDCVSISASGNAVVRQVAVIGDPVASAGYATVTAGSLQVFVKNTSVAVSGQVSVTGSVAISNTVTVTGQVSVTGSVAISNNINISAMPAVALAAGAANIGTVNNISAAVVLGAGAANIGTINNISAAITLANGATVNISTMPAVVLGAGAANIGTVNNISAAVVLAAGTALIGAVSNAAGTALMGAVSLAAGTANIGFLNNISATVLVAGEVANGASLSTTNKPVLMGGNDSAGGAGGVARTLLLDTSGRIILGAGAQNIGTVNNISAAIVLAAGTAHVGEVNISVFPALVAGTANIGAVSLAAGTANIGFINGISANVNVVLQTGTNNIGTVQAISAAVGLAAGTNNIGGVSLVAGTALIGAVSLAAGTANIGSINNISAVVSVNIAAQSAGNILAVQGPVVANASVTAGNAPVLWGGRVKTSASTTATAHAAVFAWFDKTGRQVVVMNHPSLIPSASHGPKTVTISTSASVALIAAPGAGLVAYVDSILVTNGSATLTRADIYETSATATPVVAAYLAASGGGFSHKFDPPWRVSANTVLNARVKPNVSQCLFVIHFHVGVD